MVAQRSPHFHIAVIDGRNVNEIERFEDREEAEANLFRFGDSYRKQWDAEPALLSCTHGRCFHPTSPFKYNGRSLCRDILRYADRVRTAMTDSLEAPRPELVAEIRRLINLSCEGTNHRFTLASTLFDHAPWILAQLEQAERRQFERDALLATVREYAMGRDGRKWAIRTLEALGVSDGIAEPGSLKHASAIDPETLAR